MTTATTKTPISHFIHTFCEWLYQPASKQQTTNSEAQRHALSHLDEHTLKDIGTLRTQAIITAAKLSGGLQR